MPTPDITLERGLPVNLDAERFVLGSILTDDTAFIQTSFPGFIEMMRAMGGDLS